MKPFAKKFYKSASWRKCRDAYFNSQQGMCERCESPGKIVHHKTWLTSKNINDPCISLNYEELELLCQDCHNKEHHSTSCSRREDVKFNKMGELVKVGDKTK
ncbi:HNH endonuclease [Pontibacillus salipaludis]|uniref:HNH endonuclease n=1 Tax=Pontibacillus salipaludis TaxID=1697394 RepID=A0ABQ1PIH1_9BACI|nr:HNH endonuclease [Pontibacillus salipaludis]GGC97829.1 hypothetical protein GCM10011389_01200 [Pontibacillus salipaludis]